MESVGIFRGTLKCCNPRRTFSGEGADLSSTDVELLKHGDQKGLDTLVVHAINDEC